MTSLSEPLSTEDTSSSVTTSSRKLGKKTRSRVSFQADKKEPLTRLEIMKAELDRMNTRDQNAETREREHRREMVRQERERMDQEKRDKGLQMYPDSRKSKQHIEKALYKETKHSMQEERTMVAAETARLKNEISMKYGLHKKKKKGAPDLVEMAAEFIEPNKCQNVYGLPERVLRELTLDELNDLKSIFELFDVANAGFIRRKDAVSIMSIMGFRGNKSMWTGIIGMHIIADSVAKDHVGKVSFINFVDIVIKSQEGSDPFEEVQQCFRLLDVDDKGYITFEDVRSAADDADCNLTNRMIREMIDEADTSGDAQVSLDEFTLIMLRTGAFTFQ